MKSATSNSPSDVANTSFYADSKAFDPDTHTLMAMGGNSA